MKKLLSFIFATMLALQAFAYDFQSGELYYNITSRSEPYTVEVTCQYDWWQEEENYSGLTSVIIPSTVTDDGITYSVTSIGMYAFYRCNSLTNITIPNSITRISRGAFLSCENLQFKEYENAYYLGTNNNDYYWLIGVKNAEITSCVINDSCRVICDDVFNCCSNLTTVIIGKFVKNIGSSAFSQCFNLKSINIPETVTKIEAYAFYQCSNLTSLTIPNTVSEIGYDAFATVKNIMYSGSAEGSPWGALNVNGVADADGFFYADAEKTLLTAYVGNDTDVTIPSGVTRIGNSAFYGCTNMKTITIPNTIEGVGEGVFNNCSNLRYNEYDSAYYLGNTSTPYLCLVKAKATNITKCEINNNCKIICGNAFIGSANLSMINIPNSVIFIGAFAFGGCNNTVMTIPQSVVEIGNGAFFCNEATIYCQAASKSDGWQDGYGDNVKWNCKVLNVNTNNKVFGVVSAIGNYSIKGDDGSFWYQNETTNKTITLTAVPNEGYHFVKWSDGNTEPTRTIAVTESGNYTAEFAINVYTVTTLTENGLVVGGGTYTHGKQATLIATPSIGYQFLCWNDVVTENPRTFTVTKDTTFTAVFEPKTVVDTIKLEVPVIVHDTVKIEVLVRDTIKTIEHDTIRVEVVKNDTIYKTDTIKYYSGVKLVHDTIFVTKLDTIYVFKDVKFVHDTVKTDVLVHDTVVYYKDVKFVHDTIYITKTDTIYLQTAVSETNAIGLKVYPNPTVSFVIVNADAEFSFVLTDINGKLLRKEENASSYMLDLLEYPDGVYLLNTSDGATHRIVKK